MDNMTDEQFIKELERRADAFFNECLKNELVKIKEKIVDIEEPDHDFEGFYYCFEETLKIIDKRIFELKGDK